MNSSVRSLIKINRFNQKIQTLLVEKQSIETSQSQQINTNSSNSTTSSNSSSDNYSYSDSDGNSDNN